MPTLHWIGKDKVINHHLDVPFKVLEHAYRYEWGVGSGELELNTQYSTLITQHSTLNTHNSNKIIHGDNLEALKALLPAYEGKIKCIYIDPPYNTGNENWVYNDNVNDPKMKRWLGQVVGKEAEDLTRHDKWLCMMYPRLKLLHKLLAEDGAIFISIDDNEQASLKLVMDEIFGVSNFIGTITWIKKTKPVNSGKARFQLQKKVEYIFAYSKDNNKIQNFNLEIKGERKYQHQNEFGFFRLFDLEDSDYGEKSRETMKFEILGIKPQIGKRWKIGKEEADKLIENGRIMIVEGKVKKVIYDFDEGSDIASPFWSHFDEKEVGTAETGKKSLTDILGKSVGFDTVKPIELVKKLLFHVTNKDSLILDSFAGSGTTAHAVLNLNRQDGGNRKFILIEMEDYAESITAERVRRVINGYSNTEGTGGSFDFYTLGAPMFHEDGNLNEAVGEAKIREYVYYTETKEVMSYELLVSSDELELITQNSTPITKKHNSKFITDNPHFLGKHNETSYYFYYEREAITTLDHDFLATMHTRAEQYVIYADNCLLTQEFMQKHHIIFKKIPRDISRF